jgi:hypothetical protein
MPRHLFHFDTPDDPRFDRALELLREIQQELHTMSETQDTLAAEVATLKSNMAGLHTGISDIQTRLAAALASGGGDPAVLADLHAINSDLEAVVAALAPAPPAPPAA